MLSPELKREIREEIRQFMRIILPALASSNTSQVESINNLYPGMSEIPDRPIMHPYGLVSRAPVNTNSITARVGEHISNRITLGHIDNERKNISLNEGEVVLYNQFGQQIRLENEKINLGKNANEPAVLGQQLLDLLTDIIDKLIAGDLFLTTTAGNPTAANPLRVAELNALKTQYITTEDTNIISQEVFLERKST